MVWTHGENGRVIIGEENSRSDVRGVRLRGRSRMGWIDGVKEECLWSNKG